MIDRLLEFTGQDSYGLRPDRILTPLGPISDTPLLVVDRGRISSCGPEADTLTRLDPPDVLRLPGMTIVPGVVDTHNHVATPFPKAMTFGEPAQLWKRVWFPVQAAATDETCYLGSKWTFLEALRGNPVASQWKGNAAADALAWRELGIRFGLGTDVTRNDAFRLIDAADATHRIAHSMVIDDFAGGTGSLWWQAATVGGARAAGLTDVGELRPGACADYLLLDSSTPETLPSWDLEWELARFYDKSNINAVVVGGKPRVIEGRPVGWELEEFLDEALEVGLAQIARARPRTICQGDWSAIMLPKSVDG